MCKSLPCFPHLQTCRRKPAQVNLGVSAVALLLTIPWPAQKWHDNATLYTSQSCMLCCIAGLDPGIVSTSSSAFHVLWFSSSSVSLVSLLFSAYSTDSTYAYAGARYTQGGPHIMLRFEMKTLLVNRTSIDGTGISIHHLLFSPHNHPIRSCVTSVQSVPTHCATACSHLHTLNLRPWHCDPSAIFTFRSHSILFRVNIRLVSRCGFAFCQPRHIAAPREVACKVHHITM